MKNLNKLYYLKLEIEDLKKEIDNLTYIGSPALTGMPHGGTTSNPTEQYLIKKQKLIDKLSNTLEVYIDELERVEEVVSSIDDQEIRTIARLRYIDNLKWEEIGYKMNFDRSVCYRKLNKYFKEKEKK